jgi:cation diffusion facilitator CzcD-associated flavoprotein CzcO
MEMKIQERPGGTWTLKTMDGSTARPPKDYCSHNHSPNDVKTYPQHHQFSEEQLRVVKTGRTAGVPPNWTKASLKAAILIMK